MTDFNKIHMLAAAIIKVRLNRAGDAEREFLLGWLDEDEKNRTTYRDIIRGVTIREHLATTDRIERETDFERLKQEVAARLARTHTVRRRRLTGIAAAAVGIICVAGALFLAPERTDRNAAVTGSQAGGNVQLILHTGQRFDVDGEGSSVEELVAQAAAGLATDTADATTDGADVPMNRLVTFREGLGCITLEDGSEVWLNAMSELDFPAVFTGGERRVKLKGEAYFEVNADPARPFIVETAGVAVRALGTSFNVQSYADEESVYATLLTGKVEVTDAAGGSVVLDPGMQSVWNRTTQKLTRENVAAADFTAWRDGYVIFTEKPLQDITRALTRWYDADFIYAPDYAGDHTFTLKINRQLSLESILDLITTAGGPAFEAEGRKVYVTRR